MEVEETGSGYFMEAVQESHEVDKESLPKNCIVSDAALSASAGGCFDCNICLDFAVDPVVTLCGHLYCWPCIYRWLEQQVESDSPQQQCPVCKASLTINALVPLYGRGHTTKPPHPSLKDIPRRPSVRPDPARSEPESVQDDHDAAAAGLHLSPILQHRQQHDRPYYSSYVDNISAPSSPLGTLSGTRRMYSTTRGVLGGMAFASLPWGLRNQGAGVGMYYSSPRRMGGGGGELSPRLRRQEMRVERSLHQIWVFLFCCALLCLILF